MAVAIGCALLMLYAAGCATSRKAALAPNSRSVRGTPQAPASLRREAESGNASVEVAMGLRESTLRRYKQANFWYRKAAV